MFSLGDPARPPPHTLFLQAVEEACNCVCVCPCQCWSSLGSGIGRFMRKFECCADRATATAVSEPPQRVACQSVCWKSESKRGPKFSGSQLVRRLRITGVRKIYTSYRFWIGLEMIWNQNRVQRFPNVDINDLIPKKKASIFSFDLGK